MTMNDSQICIAGGPAPRQRRPARLDTPTPEAAADIIAIGQLLVRYAHLLDSDDMPATALADLFTTDGIVEPAYAGEQRHAGRSAVTSFFADYLATTRASSRLRRHVVSTERIEVDGDHGWAFSLLDASGIQVADPHLGLYVGSYEDTLERRDGCWRFTCRRIRLDWAWKARDYSICRNGQQVLDGSPEQ